jgi:hypothetical protein
MDICKNVEAGSTMDDAASDWLALLPRRPLDEERNLELAKG